MLTFIVYFITSICGWLNFLIAHLTMGKYFPVKNYLNVFNNRHIININEITKSIYNFSGYLVKIKTNFPYKIIDDVFFTLLSTLLVILFLIGYKLVKTQKISQTEIIKWSVVLSFLMTFALPSHSSDLFGYIARGAQQTLFHQNPYIHTVSEVKNYSSYPLFLNFMWPNQPTTYGPVFIYITKAIVFLSNNNLFLSFINFKLLNLTIFFLLILFLVRSSDNEDLYLIAWNPLILIQGLWNCHNDLISGVLICVGFILLSNKTKINNNIFWSIFCLTFACGIKYISLIALPFVLIYVFHKGFSLRKSVNFILGFCAGSILILIFSLDYLNTINWLSEQCLCKLVGNVNLVHQSLIETIATLIKDLCKLFGIKYDLFIIYHLLKSLIYLVFGLFYFYMLFFRKKSNLISVIAWMLFIFLAFTIAKFHSWYLLNIIFLIPLLKDSLIKKLLIAVSLSHVYAITFVDQSKILNFVSMTLLPCIYTLVKQRKINH